MTKKKVQEDKIKKENLDADKSGNDEVVKLKSEKDEFEAKYKRALADYQNLLKRTTEEKNQFAKYANEILLVEILPVYDNLKISLEYGNEKNHDAWIEGIKHVKNQFRDVLINGGVEEIKTIGEKFNPEIMEAVEGNGEIVKREIKPGYKLNGKLILPAKVVLENND